MSFIKTHSILIMLILLVLGISTLSYFNYKAQKDILFKQMHNNSLNIVNSISSSLEKLKDIKSTMSIQKLVNDISFDLEIFEFRYLSPAGIIKNSIFKDEIGKALRSKSFIDIQNKKRRLNSFFFEIRDYVDVMSIYYPIYDNNKLIGIIDLCVDISEYKINKKLNKTHMIFQRQTDIQNLLKSINGSIINSISILKSANINEFLHSYSNNAKNILEISVLDNEKLVYISSNKNKIGKKINLSTLVKSSLIIYKNKSVFRSIVDFNTAQNNSQKTLLLYTDATTYNEDINQLLTTAILSSLLALLFALFISVSIYFSAISQSRQEKERLEHLVQKRTQEIELLSKIDALTGLWNRGYLEENLEQEFKRAKRYNLDMSLMILDLDHFKNINDSYGHMAGDEVLRQVSQRIQKCLRETDFIGRYGGEEIVVILPETTLKASKLIANKILKVISTNSVKFKSTNINITTSIGISSLRKEHNDYKMIFTEADEALYLAKNLGRNRVEVFTIMTQLFKSE